MNQPSSPSPVSNGDPSAAPPIRVAMVSSSWHRDIVDQAVEAAHGELRRSWPTGSQLDNFQVPGAFEIPLLAKRLAQSGRYDAIIACGLVVNGGIYRHEFVAAAVIDGLMRVQLDTDVPVLSAVLTPRDFHDHAEHQHFFAQHFVKKGMEVAQACLGALVARQALERQLALP